MQLVVEISEDTFFDLKKKQNRTEVDNAVLNGTPLPKGHGVLKDSDLLDKRLNMAEIELLEQEPILDKIRAEILQLKTKTSYTFVNIDDVLRLIDKHMESEENNDTD